MDYNETIGHIIGKLDHSPSFMTFEPLSKGRYWLLLVWVILDTKYLWKRFFRRRNAPREIAFGKYTWLIYGFGWGLFHVAFGWHLLLTLLPFIFIQSYIVQKTKIHGMV